MEAEKVEKRFFALLRSISRAEEPSHNLELFMNEIKSFCNSNDVELREFLGDVFIDVICEEVNEIINDSDWRSDEVGEKCISDPDILRELYPILTTLEENIEIVFATNPNTPIDILDKLAESTFEWEEDGTASTLARNTNNAQLLRKLANNSEPSIRYSVASNPNTPSDVLLSLAADEDFSEHMVYVTFDGGLSPVAIDAADELVKCAIKFVVIHNVSTPLEAITQIANDDVNFRDTNIQSFDSEFSGANLILTREASRVLKERTSVPGGS